MAQDAFDSFINSVYGSGTAMGHFDSYSGVITAGEVIDDISVKSIFGSGVDPSSTDYDSDEENTQQNKSCDGDDSDCESTDAEDCKDDSNCEDDSECKSVDAEDCKSNKSTDDDLIIDVEIQLTKIDSDSDSDSDGEDSTSDEDSDDEAITSDISLDLSSMAKKEVKKGRGLDAHEVSMLLAPYK